MIDRVYDQFFAAGEVTEIRAFGLHGRNSGWEGSAYGEGCVFGYFDQAAAFAAAAVSLDKARARGIYFTLNPVVPDLLARCANRLQAATGKTPSTSDRDIQVIRWLPIDLDPVRPAGISATREELAAAWTVAKSITSWLVESGITPLQAISGNGAHVLVRLDDLPNNPESAALVQGAIRAVAARFSTDQVKVDRAVGNPARIWKLYGTMVRKGDDTESRPHRRAYIVEGDHDG